MVARRSAAALAALIAAGGIAACGTGDRAEDAAAVVERFHAALADRDGEAACSELAEATASELEKSEGAPCAEAILDLELTAGGEAAATDVYTTSAAVVLTEGGTDFLDQGPSGWVIASAGCRPTTPDMPYDCELRS